MSLFGHQLKRQSSASDVPQSTHTRLYARSTGNREIVSQNNSGNEAPVSYAVFTTDTTDATPVEVANIDVAEGDKLKLIVEILATQDDESDCVIGRVEGCFYRNTAGNVTQIGTTQDDTYTNSGAGSPPSLALSVDTGDQQIDVDWTGVASENWDVTVYIKRFDMGA